MFIATLGSKWIIKKWKKDKMKTGRNVKRKEYIILYICVCIFIYTWIYIYLYTWIERRTCTYVLHLFILCILSLWKLHVKCHWKCISSIVIFLQFSFRILSISLLVFDYTSLQNLIFCAVWKRRVIFHNIWCTESEYVSENCSITSGFWEKWDWNAWKTRVFENLYLNLICERF